MTDRQAYFAMQSHNDAVTGVQVTRAEVLRGFEEAIDLARSRANPAAIVAGWREIAKMCGYYAP